MQSSKQVHERSAIGHDKSHAHERGTLFVKNEPAGVALPYSNSVDYPLPAG